MAKVTKLDKAKSSLVISQPFFASLLLSMRMVERADIPTMAVDGRHIFYNASFVDKLSRDELLFVLCHEVMHCVFEHMFTRGSRDPFLWNVAGDYIINEVLVSSGVGARPQGALYDTALTRSAGQTTVGVYNKLLERFPPQSNGQQSFGGSPLDDCMDASNDPNQQEAQAAEMRVAVAQAAQAAKMQGKLPGALERLVDQVLRPRVDWRTVLRRFVAQRAKVEPTYARPKRRFMDQDIYLPSLGGATLGALAIAVDCSGSISAQEVASFAAEIKAIHEDMRPVVIHVAYFDSAVSHTEEYRPDDQLDIRGHGGGGTAFSPVIQYFQGLADELCACVFLTDLYCSDFGDAPYFPTLWVTTGAEAAPWGEVVRMGAP